MIQDESIKVVYKGDGVNAVFDYPYALDSESLIICYIYDSLYIILFKYDLFINIVYQNA